tara:strand:+ start:93 stop:674 length:582 start_codon:yes stop_codon:yes gene_type:complete
MVINKLFLILILTLSFQTLSKADDIRDFQIEGISIGDNLLDYFSVDEIKIESGRAIQYPKSQEFINSQFFNNLETYDVVIINYKRINKDYKIYGVAGVLDYKSTIKLCYKKMDEINNNVKNIFPSLKSEREKSKLPGDTTGKSYETAIYYVFKSGGYVTISCYDWSEGSGFNDHLRFSITSKDFGFFLENEAY